MVRLRQQARPLRAEVALLSRAQTGIALEWRERIPGSDG